MATVMGVSPSFPRRRESRLDPGSESGVTVSFCESDKNFGNWYTLPILTRISTPLGVRPLRGQYDRAVGNATPHHVYFIKRGCLLDHLHQCALKRVVLNHSSSFRFG